MLWKNSFGKRYELEVGDYSEKEIKRAKELSEEKYSTKKWNEMR